jgi:rare lipoprotein A
MLRPLMLRGLAAAGLLVMASAAALAADEIRVKGDSVNLRDGPSEDAKVQDRVGPGDELVQLKREGDWYKVRLKASGKEGWIAAALIESKAAELEKAPAAGDGGSDGAGQVVFREEGEASVYDDKFQGKKTASGKRFDQKQPQAAHPDLPLGSEATVVNPDTGKKVEVEIVDRGPHAKGRDLDLSEGAAARLGITKDVKKEGDAEVHIEATKDQVQQAIEDSEDVGKVEKQLKKARQSAAKDGTPQPAPVPKLDPPQ